MNDFVFRNPAPNEFISDAVSNAILFDINLPIGYPDVCHFTSDPFPEGCDVVLMASNLPMYNEETIGLVVRKAFGAPEPGGEMHLVGEMLGEDGIGPLDAALWGLQEVLRNSEGKAHTVGQVRGYFIAAGFETVEDRDFVPGVLRRVCGRKPRQPRREDNG